MRSYPKNLKWKYARILDYHPPRVRLVPGDQRSGRYYSGKTRYNSLQWCQKSARLHWFRIDTIFFSDDICSRHLKQIVSGEKRIVFFLPANIHGALMHLMACWLFQILHITFISNIFILLTPPFFCSHCTYCYGYGVFGVFWHIL